MRLTLDFYQVHPTVMLFLPSVFNHRGLPVVINIRIVYSDLVGYQTSDIRLLWTIITRP